MERIEQSAGQARGGVTPHLAIRDRRAAEAIDFYGRALRSRGADAATPTDDGRDHALPI